MFTPLTPFSTLHCVQQQAQNSDLEKSGFCEELSGANSFLIRRNNVVWNRALLQRVWSQGCECDCARGHVLSVFEHVQVFGDQRGAVNLAHRGFGEVLQLNETKTFEIRAIQ